MKEIKSIQARDNWELTTELLHSPEPVVLRGLINHWPAVAAAQSSNLDLAEYLMKLDAGSAITAMIAPASEGGRLFYNEDLSGFNFQYKRMGLSAAIQQIIDYTTEPTPPTLYVGSTNVDHWLPGFRDDNDVALHELNPLASIWLGNQSQIAAHFDFPSNLACVVAGRRKVTLFPPEQIENLYIGPLDFTPAGQPISLIDFKQPDLAAHPRFKDALVEAQRVELTAGDALIIPSMWWHHIEALEVFNVLVNYWWRSSPRYLGAPLNALQHAILALRDLPPEQRTAWQQLFNHHVFNNGSNTTEHIPMQARGILNPLEENSAKDLKAFLRENLQ